MSAKSGGDEDDPNRRLLEQLLRVNQCIPTIPEALSYSAYPAAVPASTCVSGPTTSKMQSQSVVRSGVSPGIVGCAPPRTQSYSELLQQAIILQQLIERQKAFLAQTKHSGNESAFHTPVKIRNLEREIADVDHADSCKTVPETSRLEATVEDRIQIPKSVSVNEVSSDYPQNDSAELSSHMTGQPCTSRDCSVAETPSSTSNKQEPTAKPKELGSGKTTEQARLHLFQVSEQNFTEAFQGLNGSTSPTRALKELREQPVRMMAYLNSRLSHIKQLLNAQGHSVNMDSNGLPIDFSSRPVDKIFRDARIELEKQRESSDVSKPKRQRFDSPSRLDEPSGR